MTSKSLCTILEIKPNLEVEKKDGSGTYQEFRFVYRREDNQKEYTERKPLFLLAQDETLRDKFNSLGVGEQRCIHKEQQGKYWRITDITAAEDAPDPTAKKFTGSYGGDKSYSKGKTFDTNGAMVGGIIHDAVAVAVADKDTSIDNIKSIAQKLIKMSQELKADLNDNPAPTPKAEPTVSSPTKEVKATKPPEDFVDDDLNDIDF